MYRSYNEYADRLIQELSLKRKSGNEYGDVPCPHCGGKDRFYITDYNGELRHHCRKDCDFIERDKELQRRDLVPIWKPEGVPYHIQKNIPLIGARLEGETVVIPLINLTTGQPSGFQEINTSSEKKFRQGAKVSGSGAYIGEPSATLYVVEGWATGVAVHIATGQQVLFALNDTGVAKSVNFVDHPNIIIAADNDEAGIKAAKATGKPWVAPVKDGDDWWDVFHREGKDAVLRGLKQETRLLPSLPYHLDYLSDIKLEPLKFLIDNIIPQNCFSAVVGPSYSFKTFIALDMALCVAAGLPFHGMETQQGTVIYVNGEGRHGIMTRIDAWCQSKSVNRKKLPFILSSTPINLRDEPEVAILKSVNEDVPDVRMIVIDTLNRNAGGMNENAPVDMAEFVNACSSMVHHFDCAVCVIHHTGKDTSSGARGHSSFYAALDTEISVKKLGDHDVQMICSKQKDAPEFETIQFIAVSTLDSIILEKTETRKANAKNKLTADQKLALECLQELIEANTATNGDVAGKNVHLDKWRHEFKRRHTGDNEKSKNTAHQRARNTLVSLRLVEVKDDFYSLGDKAT